MNAALRAHAMLADPLAEWPKIEHEPNDVPHLLIGGASGQLKGNRHLAYPSKTVTSGNLLLSVLDLYGVHQDSIGDSTGTLPNLV